MLNKFKTEKLMNLAFLITLFFMPIETAMTLRLGSLSPYKISFIILVVLMLYSWFSGGFLSYLRSFWTGFLNFKWAIISIVLYFGFDLVSLAWTNDIMFSVKKYVTIFPMLILAIYACYYFFGEAINLKERKKRLRQLALTMGLVSLFLSLLTWITYFLFSRTYYILTLSLQSDYNQYILPVLLGYICGVYYINTMKLGWQRYALFAGFSMISMPIFYLSGSRRTMVMYLGVFAVLSLYFLITNMVRNKNVFTFLISLAIIAGILFGHKVIIDGFSYYSNYVYKTMEEEAMKKGIKAPSAQMDKSEGIIHGFRLEQDANWKESSLESGEAMGRRQALWTIAINELKTYSGKELLIGKGGSHQRDLYRREESRELLFQDGTPDMGQDFHPHSMIFLELLNGGIIKLVLSLSLVLSIVFYDFYLLFKKRFHEFVIISAYGGVFILNQLIDSIYGILQNRLTWILLYIVLGAMAVVNYSKNKQKKKVKQ